MIMGKDEPDSGTITVGSTVQMIGVGQERMEELDASKNVWEEISEGLDEISLGTQNVPSRAYVSWVSRVFEFVISRISLIHIPYFRRKVRFQKRVSASNCRKFKWW